jgi:hypothetical protein
MEASQKTSLVNAHMKAFMEDSLVGAHMETFMETFLNQVPNGV